MKQEALQEEVLKILQGAPAARKALLENHQNLLNVSEYCTNNYVQSGEDTLKALEETKNFTTQSLASVAYQISTLASSVLNLLDAQTNQLRHMESSINLIGQTVEMHKEKVSRREIGAFTAVRRVSRGHKILPPNPTSTEPRPAYSRRPISYQQLDSLGHGIKVSGKQLERTGTIRKHGASIRTAKAPDPVHCPVAPPSTGSSFGKPVAPPTIPSTFPAAPTCDTVSPLLDEDVTPPMEVSDDVPAPPAGPSDSSVPNVVPPPPPPPPPPAPAPFEVSVLAPPLLLPTVEEEGGLPSPSPPPPIPEDEPLPAISSEATELPAPPPPPPSNQDGDDLEIPAPPPPLLLDDFGVCDDSVAPLPPPVDDDTMAPLHYLDKVVVLYDYQASRPDDLTLAEGDVIYLTRRHDDGWCEGVLHGNTGFFPENYVQPCD